MRGDRGRGAAAAEAPLDLQLAAVGQGLGVDLQLAEVARVPDLKLQYRYSDNCKLTAVGKSEVRRLLPDCKKIQLL